MTNPVAVVSATPTAAYAWQRVPEQAALEGTGLTSVVWTGARFLATGLPGNPMLLDSVDGLVWHRQPPFATTAWTSGPTLVAAGPGGAVAFGGGYGPGRLAVWHSTDGLTWSAAPDQAAFESSGPFGGVNAVVSSGDGWLAVGGEFYNSTEPALVRAVVLESPDGLHWTRQPDSAALEHAEINAIARTPSGYVAVGAVVGTSSAGVAELGPAVWTSSDGKAWSVSQKPPAFDQPAGAGRTDVILDGIAALGGRLVVVGEVDRYDADGTSSGAPTAVAWRSDGGAWTRVVIDPSAHRHPHTLIATAGELIAVTGPESSCATGAMSSADGSAWSCLGTDPAFAGFTITGAAASPELETLVGYTFRPDDTPVGAVWTRARR